MRPEDKNREYKSLRKAIGSKANHRSLAETCVCFANAQGGEIIIGIEDGNDAPPSAQSINQKDMNKLIKSLRELTDGVGLVGPEIKKHDNGGEYISLKILPSTRTIATTSSGKVFIRVSDNCFPIGSEELTNLAAEKTAFQWEIMTVQKVRLADADIQKIETLYKDLLDSDKVSGFIKQKDQREVFAYYQLLDPAGYLTNLGILWLGTPAQRARLSYPVTVQYIVYNEQQEKVRKTDWHFHLHNPKELLLDIEEEVVELTYSSELPNGMFRKNIRHYPREVVRELLVNAIAHKKYTISGDLFIEVYPDKMKITNPGGLPLGITSGNILHQRHRRNPHLIQLMSALNLMEGEGSGYDMVYERLARDAKPLPIVESAFLNTSVTVASGIINPTTISVLDYVDKHFTLTQKEYITLGIVAAAKKIRTTQLAQKLQLEQEDRMRSWVGTLIDKAILIKHGERKGTNYLLNPKLFEQAKIDVVPSLKTMEPYKLEALVREDLKYNGISKMAEIKKRLEGIPAADIQKTVYNMVDKGLLTIHGAKRNRTYQLVKK